MNNKPIAWYNADDSSLSFKNHGDGWEPLYNHPENTLTDEEILDTFDPHFDADIEDKELIKFARAILKKAQEK